MKLSLTSALKKAEDAKKNGKLDIAIEIFSIIISSYPENGPANFNLGILAIHKNDVAKSLEFFQRAVKGSPTNERYWEYYVDTLLKAGRSNEAQTAIVRAHNNGVISDSLSRFEAKISASTCDDIDMKNDKADLNLARFSEPSLEQIKGVVNDFDQGNFELSLKGAKGLLMKFPKSATLYCIQGASQSGLKQFDSAMNSFENALQINPNYANAYNNMANAQKDYGDLRAAIDNYGKAIEINESYVTAYINRGNAHRAMCDFKEMINDFNKAKYLDPKNDQIYLNLAIGLQDIGKIKEASDNYKKALEYQPASYLSFFRLHSTYYRDMNVDYDSAIECLKQAFQITRSNGAITFFLGLLLDYKGEESEAESYFSLIQETEAEFHGYLDSWSWVKSFSAEYPKLYWQKNDGFNYAFECAANEGLILEFGVASGVSIRRLASMTEQEIHGFDSFEGLPEKWMDLPKGAFNLSGEPPSAPEHVNFHVGLFSETLPSFLEEYNGSVKFLNIDCDLYSSTKTVLKLLESRIIPGTVIFFDEYLGYPGWRDQEFRAFQEAVERNDWKYEYLAINLFRQQSIVKIL
ncbi:MAG: tetratricopeptide repeat protein [Gammaproteobacteria bacterium]|nr:tetratricopeptide repeat protein [Gammaproteobacteria bacterium]